LGSPRPGFCLFK